MSNVSLSISWFSVMLILSGTVSHAQEQKQLPRHVNTIGTMSLSKDGKTLATSVANFVALWDIETLEAKGEIQGEYKECSFLPSYSGRRPVHAGFLSPDGKYLVANTSELYELKEPGVTGWGATPFVAVWDLSTKKELRRMKGLYPRAISPDNKTIACTKLEAPLGEVLLYDFITGKEYGTLKVHRDGVGSVAFSFDGRLLASGSFFDPAVRVWDVAKQQELLSFDAPWQGGGGTPAFSFSPDGTQIAIGGYRPIDVNLKDEPVSVVKVYDLSPKKAWIPLVVKNRYVHAMQFSPDGRKLAVGHDGRDVEVWDLKSRERSGVFRGGQGRKHLAFTPDGKTLIVACGRTVELWPVPKEQ
ncbi:MAG: hypothetical protein K2R98_01645 [Gemmataceae bacterium]|nr:hypothetical protein [Gemmataceae bacterium]